MPGNERINRCVKPENTENTALSLGLIGAFAALLDQITHLDPAFHHIGQLFQNVVNVFSARPQHPWS